MFEILKQQKIYFNKKKEEGINVHLIPKLSFISLNFSEKTFSEKDSKFKEDLKDFIEKISYQKPKATFLKKPFLNMRANTHLGYSVTLRRNKAHLFFDKLVFLVLPKFHSFEGFKEESINFFPKKNFCSITFGITDLNYFEISRNLLKKEGIFCTIGVNQVDSKESFINFIQTLTGIPFRRKNVKIK